MPIPSIETIKGIACLWALLIGPFIAVGALAWGLEYLSR